MTSGGRYDKRSPAWRGTAEAMELIGSEPVAEKQGAQLFFSIFFPTAVLRVSPFILKGQHLPYLPLSTGALDGKQVEVALTASQE